MLVELHRPVSGAVEDVHHVLEERVGRGRCVRVGPDDFLELAGRLLGLVLVLRRLLDAEHAGLAPLGEQGVEVVVDAAGDLGADPLDLEGVAGVGLELEDAHGRVADVEVLADAAGPVAADHAPAVRFGVALHDVSENVLPVADAHVRSLVVLVNEPIGLCQRRPHRTRGRPAPEATARAELGRQLGED